MPVEFDGTLVVKFSDEVSDYDGEVMWLSPSAGSVDLTQYVYESILLSLPYQRVHPDGECDPEMLGRFRIVTGEEFDRLEQQAGLAGRCHAGVGRSAPPDGRVARRGKRGMKRLI